VGTETEAATATTIVDRIDRNDHRLGSATIASTATIIDWSIALTSNIIDGKGRNDHRSHRLQRSSIASITERINHRSHRPQPDIEDAPL
jgi:hypothetical protein